MESDNKTQTLTLLRELHARADADWEFVSKTETNGNTCNAYRKLNMDGQPYTAF